jgi:hypothetical protein
MAFHPIIQTIFLHCFHISLFLTYKSMIFQHLAPPHRRVAKPSRHNAYEVIPMDIPHSQSAGLTAIGVADPAPLSRAGDALQRDQFFTCAFQSFPQGPPHDPDRG